ncbi:MAG: hypothetical protein HYX46_08430 [Betaproteobacteria bacterium]|nr:hypothetical protein [Betaproteobacteria bacterium]
MGALERMVVLVTPEQRETIRARAKAEKLTMGEIVRRSVERYGSQADEAALEKLIEKVEESTDRANRALDRGLAALAAGMARIDRMEKQAARRRGSKPRSR